MVSDERALATWLAARDDASLARVLFSRAVAPHSPWTDFFDAAEALLDSASIDKALIGLDRDALAFLADSTADDAARARVVALALAHDSGEPYAAVATQVAALRASRPDAFVPGPAPEAPDAADEAQTAAAAERAFEATGSLADVLLACLHTPLTRTGTGVIGAADRRRLLEAHAVPTAEALEDALLVAASSGLARADDRIWTVTARGADWLEASTVDRWTLIVTGIRSSLPADLRTADGGFLRVTEWPGHRPLDADWPQRAHRYRDIAAHWGIIDPSGAEPAWTAPLRQGGEVDVEALSTHLVAEIDKVYLQADLTAIAPGPLHPALDLRLRALAHRESRAQASTYRFTADSLGAGMTEGETGASIRAFLEELSLTGIPQPLAYLIESTAARHGLVRVAVDQETGRTVVTSGDAGILQTIAVDQALRPLGLVTEDDHLTSRVPRDAVYWSLADARYPVVALDDDGAPEPIRRRSIDVPLSAPSTPVETYAALLARLRSGHDTDGEAGWLERELEQSVRNRTEIAVTVRMPDASERIFFLEATGLGGGRLRGRDKAADIERTLPVSSIVHVAPSLR